MNIAFPGAMAYCRGSKLDTVFGFQIKGRFLLVREEGQSGFSKIGDPPRADFTARWGYGLRSGAWSSRRPGTWAHLSQREVRCLPSQKSQQMFALLSFHRTCALSSPFHIILCAGISYTPAFGHWASMSLWGRGEGLQVQGVLPWWCS